MFNLTHLLELIIEKALESKNVFRFKFMFSIKICIYYDLDAQIIANTFLNFVAC